MTDNTFRRPIAWRSHALTDVGCVRDANEDAYLSNNDRCFWVVADGMGGHQIGDVASKKIVERLNLVQPELSLANYVDTVEDALMQVNAQLLEHSQNELQNQTMGSTVVSMFIKNHVGISMWVGDSRLYRLRNRQLQQLTRDHSQVEEMLRLGLISAEDAKTHPNRNVITRAVGVEPNLYVDINVFSVQVGDTFLLCSDGLYNSVSSNDIKAQLTHKDPQTCATHLMGLSLENNADDNVSLIVVKGEPGKV